MLPLTTVWAFTIWKSPGHTFTGKVVLNVSDHKREHGLTYVAFYLLLRGLKCSAATD